MSFSIFTYAAPQRFYFFAGRLVPWFSVLSLILCTMGLYIGFFVAPTDAQQGDAYRIIFIHVPAAWMSMFLYVVMAVWSTVGLVYGTRLSACMARAIAPTGALFTAIALLTGAIWGKPTWGTWWVWDARLTSELILLFLYAGYLLLEVSIEDPVRADKALALLALVGAFNIPLIYFSVRWWNTLHQGASVSMTASPSMASTMLTSMLIMSLAAWSYAIAVILQRVRQQILVRESHTQWVQELNKQG